MADQIDFAAPGAAGEPLSAAIQALPVVNEVDSSSSTIGEALQAALAAATATRVDDLEAFQAQIEEEVIGAGGALDLRVRVDTDAQGLTSEQKLAGRTNIAAIAAGDVGDAAFVADDVTSPPKVRTLKEWKAARGIYFDDLNTFSEAVLRGVSGAKAVFVPAGDISLSSAVTVSALTAPFRLELDPSARLIAGAALAGAILRIDACAGHRVEIAGGIWDASAQPAPGVGESWALVYLANVGGGEIHGAHFVGADPEGFDDYRDGLSDSAIFVWGEDITIRGNRFRGFYDSAIYESGNSSQVGTHSVRVMQNIFDGVAVAFISKRQGLCASFIGNTVRDSRIGCATGIADTVKLPGRRLIISDNHFQDVGLPIRLELAHGSVVSGNSIDGWGYDAAGDLMTSPFGIQLLGTQGAAIVGNRIALGASTASTDLHAIALVATTIDGVTTQSTDNLVAGNIFDAGSGSGCGRCVYEANATNRTHAPGSLVIGTWAAPYVMISAESAGDYVADGIRHVISAGGERGRVQSSAWIWAPAASGTGVDTVGIKATGGGGPLRVVTDGATALQIARLTSLGAVLEVYAAGAIRGSVGADANGVTITPASGESLTVELPTGEKMLLPRSGVAEQRLEIFEDGSGAHIRGQSLVTAKKKNLFEAISTGSGTASGALGHSFSVAGTVKFDIDEVGVGFYGAAPVAQPTVTGSRGSNAALASLLTALAQYGLIVDGTS